MPMIAYEKLHLPLLDETHFPKWPLMLNGVDWVPTTAEGFITVKCPATGKLVGTTFRINDESVLEEISHAAQTGFETYSKTTWQDRAEILDRYAVLLEERQETLARLISLEVGKPVKFSTLEVQRGTQLVKLYAEKVQQLATKETDRRVLSENHWAHESLRPLGPVLAYTPFNFPLNLVMHKLAPAIGAGTSIVIKPTSRAPLTAYAIAKLAVEAGYTAISVVNLAHGPAEKLVTDPRYKIFTFTGGNVGWDLAKALPLTTGKVLELGSNSPLIIEDVASNDVLKIIAQKAAASAFGFSGQTCISTQRIYVQEKLYPEFLSVFSDVVSNIQQGDILDADTMLGPMIDEKSANETQERITDALKNGAQLLGDQDSNRILKSGWVKPTVLLNTTPEMRVNKEELFAPVATVTSYKAFEEALALANETELGLHAGIYTQSSDKACLADQTLKVRGVNINEVPSCRDDRLPYGGVMKSGLGAEGVDVGIEHYCETTYRVHYQ